MDVSNSTYKDRKEDLTYPAPGCGAGAWDGLPPGHKAQQVDLDVAAPVLSKLGLPASMEGACGAGRCEGAVGVAPILLTLRAPAHPPPSAGYACLFGRAYLGSPLGRGAVWEAAQRHEEVEELRYKARRALRWHTPLAAAHALCASPLRRWPWRQRCTTRLE